MGSELNNLRMQFQQVSAAAKKYVPAYLQPLVYQGLAFHNKTHAQQTVPDTLGHNVCRDGSFWVAWGADLTTQDGSMTIFVTEMICERLPVTETLLDSKPVVFGLPSVLALPISSVPVVITCELDLPSRMDDLQDDPANHSSWYAFDLDGNLSSWPLSKACKLEVTFRAWSLNGDPAPSVLFSWGMVAEGGYVGLLHIIQ